MEQILDEYWGKEDKIPFDSFNDLYLGKKIAAITKGIATIRENARKYRVIDNKTQYIKGLIIMATSLNTHPQINRGTILHSIAFHINKIRMADLNFLSYDKLYKASGILWPDEPGRMVVKASKLNKPGYCLDIGCGDGKNMLFLEKLGWTVIGVDKSKYAINGAYKRYLINEKDFNGKLIRMDAVDYEYIDESFDLIVCYGLYHCLNDAEIECINKGIIRSLKHNGLLAFASFNNNKPLPYNHETEGIILRPENHIFETLGQNLILIDKEVGFIKESHRPLVPEHEHSLTWALFRKI
jgi:SAM-dependent methyltransferase